MRLGELADGGHVGGLAKNVDGENHFGAFGDFGVSVLGIEVEGIRVGIDENRRGARAGDTAGGGEESEGRAQHFISRPNTEAHQCEQQRIRAGRNANAVGGATARGGFIFERRNFLAKNIPA